MIQMEKQVLEQTLQQVLEQPLTHSSPTTSQKSQKSDDDKNSNKEQVQLLAGCALAWLLCGNSPACKLSVSGTSLRSLRACTRSAGFRSG